MKTPNTDLTMFKKARHWRSEQASTLFGTDGSWEWFKRTHRRKLIESGALILRSGRSGDLVRVDLIGPVVQEIIEAESRKRLDISIVA